MTIPEKYLSEQPDIVVRLFRKWSDIMRTAVRYTRANSPVHGMDHYMRVLYHALVLGYAEFGADEEALEALAQAAVWHDSRRLDENLDTGHGARAAIYYKEYCDTHPAITFHPEVPFMIRYHDLDDKLGKEAIAKEFGADAPRVTRLYEVFKDADGLDRWRLGAIGIDPAYLRTPAAKSSVDFARELVNETMHPAVLKEIQDEVERLWRKKNGSRQDGC